MTTTIYDIGLETLSLDTVARLTCIDRKMAEKGRRDNKARNHGKELYDYLVECTEYTKVIVIYQRLSKATMWEIIETQLESSRSSLPSSDIVYLPCTGPLPIIMTATGYDPALSMMRFTYNRFDISVIMPALISGAAAIFDSPQALFDGLHDRIHALCVSHAGMSGTINLEWSTDTYCFYKIDLARRRIYVTTFFYIFSSVKKISDIIDYHEVTDTFMTDVVYSLVRLRL
jgi:hypothetical protein